MRFLVFLAVVAAMTGVVKASSNDDLYRVYLYYDHGKLLFDRDVVQKVVLVKGPEVVTPGDFKAEILNKDARVLHSVMFDPRLRGIREGVGGFVLEQSKTSIDLQYFPTGAKIKIYDPAGQLILEYDISHLARASVSPSPTPSSQLPPANGQETGVSWYWWTIISVATGVLGFVLWKLWRRRLTQQSPL